MDPVLYQEGRLTTKSDVYSLGVVLLELITSKKAIDGECNLVKRFTQASAKGKGVRKLLDANIADESNMKVLEGIGKLAKECLKEDIDKRPEMNDVAGRLRELRTTLEQGQQKAGWRFFSGGQNALKKENQHGTNNVGSSSVLSKMMRLGFLTWNVANFEKNGGHILQNIDNIKIFKKEEIKNITWNFSTILGKGAFCQVYLGALDDNTRVVVKSFTHMSESIGYFAKTLISQSQMNHRNITKLLGCCLEMDLPISVNEYVPNGSLDKYLFVMPLAAGAELHDQLPLLDLNTRYQIALGVAHAIVHLHQESILHCDIKPSNILLNDHFCPKVSNFELSCMIKEETEPSLRGTIGYIAPEWIMKKPITAKADVYSFGMMLLEIVSGRHNNDIEFQQVSNNRTFPEWAYEKVCAEHQVEDILDPRIIQAEAYDANTNSLATVERMVKTAMWCIQYSAEMRPSMAEVAQMLEGTIEITKPENPYFECDSVLDYDEDVS